MAVDGDREIRVNVGICKVRGAFTLLKSVWKNTSISHKTKVRIFKNTFQSVLFHWEESWKVPKSVCQKLEVLQNKCFKRILGIYWRNKISNYGSGHILGCPRQQSRGWVCAGLQMEKRKRGRIKEKWRRSVLVERELKEKGRWQP